MFCCACLPPSQFDWLSFTYHNDVLRNVNHLSMAEPSSSPSSSSLGDDDVRLIMQRLEQRDMVVATGVCRHWKAVGRQLVPLFRLSVRGSYALGSTVKFSLPEHRPRSDLRPDAPRSSCIMPGEAVTGRTLCIAVDRTERVETHVLPHIRACVSPLAPVHGMTIRGTCAVIDGLMQSLSEHVATSSTLSLHLLRNPWPDSPPPTAGEPPEAPAPPTEIDMALVSTHRHLTGLALSHHRDTPCLDMRLIGAMTGLTSLSLKGMRLRNARGVHLPRLAHLSLEDVVFMRGLVGLLGRGAFLENHCGQLQSYRVRETHEHRLYEHRSLLKCPNLTSLDMQFMAMTEDVAVTLAGLPNLSHLSVRSLEGAMGVISPALTSIRALAASGTLVSSTLTHFELILSYGCHADQHDLVLPSSITAAYMPMALFSAAVRGCPLLRSLSLYISEHTSASAYMDDIRNTRGLWVNLVRLAIAPPHRVLDEPWDRIRCSGFHSVVCDEILLLEALLETPRALVHLTIMLRVLHGNPNSNTRLFQAIVGVPSLQTVILAHLAISLAQLEALAGMPLLEHIQLIHTSGVTEEDCLRLCRAAGAGVCGLKVTFMQDLALFNYPRDVPRYV